MWASHKEVNSLCTFQTQCQLVLSAMKKYIVIASQGKSKILNLMLDTWSDGPDPLYKDNGQSVPFGDTFLIIGGNSDRVGMSFECII